VTQAQLDEVAHKLNNRPRQTLAFRTAAEKLTELIDGLHTGAPER
jgi:IS30 family transposase